MPDELRGRYDVELREAAAALVATRAEELRAAWERPNAESLSELPEPARDAVLASLGGVLAPLAAVVREGVVTPAEPALWELAEAALRHDLPYPLVSRALRRLKRLLMRAANETAPRGTDIEELCNVLEDAIDDCRVAASRFFYELAEQRQHAAAGGGGGEEAAYLRAFIGDTADAVLVLDSQGRVRTWNQGAEQVFGYTAEEIVGRDARILVPPEEVESGRFDEIDDVVRREGYLRNHESTRLTKDGRRIDVSITRTALYDPHNGRFMGTSVVVRDVTEKRRLERESERKTRQLETINRILEATARVLDRDQTYRTIASHLATVTACDAVLVGLPDADGQSVRLRVLSGTDLGAGSERAVPRGETIVARSLARHAAVRLDDLLDSEARGVEDRRWVELGYHTALLVPLVFNNEAIGCLVLLRRDPEPFDEDDQALLQHLANHFAVTIVNARRFEEERKRAAQFELISRVGASAIANIGDVGRLMRNVVDTIQTDFGYYDVAIYEVDEDLNAFRLRAQAGQRRGRLGEGYEQPLQVGVFSEVLRTRSSYVVVDTLTDEHYFNPTPDDSTVRSELCVPIRLGPRVFGVLDVESQRANRFDRLDRTAMEALAGLLARCMEADESLRQMRMLQAMRQQIMEAVPSALLLFDDDLRVKFVNRRYLEFFGQAADQVMGAHVSDILPESLLSESRFMELVEQLRHQHHPIDQSEVRYFDFNRQERYADVRLRIVTEYETTIIVMLHDATQRLKRLYQLSMLQEIGEEMQQSLDIARLLRAILTCVTAGPGFGFNRAALFLADREHGALVESLTVGPESAEAAGRIWRDLDHKQTLREFLREYDRTPAPRVTRPSGQPPRVIAVPPQDDHLRAWRTPLMLRQDDRHQRSAVAAALRDFSGASEVLVVPLMSHENVIGLVVADNLYTGEPISRDNIRMLTTFANQAGVALANAQAYAELESSLAELRDSQDRLAQAERLAGIGSVAANVAHEIRNPLVSIGGFARRVEEKSDQAEYVRSRSAIIVREVERLEQILRNVADFTAPSKPQLAPVAINEVVEEVLQLHQPLFEEKHIRAEADLAAGLELVMADRGKLQQVLVNLVKNAVEAVGSEGSVALSTRADDEEGVEVIVRDSGPGIPADRLEEIFNPFFTSRSDGTGLGLAVSRKIVHDHGGSLTAASPPGGGAVFTMRLPRGEPGDAAAS
ncbi:MAG: GAF domain-containing protein [Armatimonadetes bacterium]|nr:GAF domain-containing protein [Armatimonadota bacterium]